MERGLDWPEEGLRIHDPLRFGSSCETVLSGGSEVRTNGTAAVSMDTYFFTERAFAEVVLAVSAV